MAFVNERYTVMARDPANGHLPRPSAERLAMTLSWQESRYVAKDWTLRWRNRVLQLPCETAEFIRSGQRVTVCEPLDGVLRVFAGEREVRWSPILSPPLPKPAKRTGPTGSNQGQKPAANHPWRGRRTAVAPSESSASLPPPAKKMAGSTSARCARLVEPAILG